MAALAACAAASARAWGDGGHAIVAVIAFERLNPGARARIEALLAADTDTLTGPGFVERATWADHWRDSDRLGARHRYDATRRWHYAGIELDGGTIDAACGGRPPLPAGTPASAGPATDCLVDKVAQFAAELRSPATPAVERVLALKYLAHFVGDLHQPLHASNRGDAGGNQLAVRPAGLTGTSNLHAYWDHRLVRGLGHDARQVGRRLARSIRDDEAQTWVRGGPQDWVLQSWALARTVAYDFGDARETVDAQGQRVLELGPAYEQRALGAVRAQLQRAGVRLAALLNDALQPPP